MYKKLISICIGSTLLLGLTACDSSKQSESSEKTNVKPQRETKKDLTSQDELNKKIKQDAEEVSFVKANGDQYAQGTRLKATGTVDLLLKSATIPSFIIGTNENGGNGMYTIQIAQSGIQSSENEITLKSGLKISKGATVTIYGVYDGKDKTGMPKISATVIEQ
ncbi:hypothetical protein P4U05_11250 [Bacillus paranthracis]|uniref:hypothetical protein n=1 Tax=Bacillus paranthracis TaxID=2026186 RepID=UPI000200EDD1|nr:hypothetical protein [Bacillus paranthracis]ADY19666.1 hypothetical protein YBT020_02070 [Bacillus thuringiensis serovar finitimus YBT-020]MEB9698077.1 hypothetical protein [Bacillus cereus]MRC71230.1 hypothetical protein [Bacillus thuringiensis]OTX74377.1 hypothetical protein BK722_06885 [Bacillus thuringiensis serovar finitimus]HDR7485387.1 hypothetical protein [Bacillus pacificus]